MTFATCGIFRYERFLNKILDFFIKELYSFASKDLKKSKDRFSGISG